MISIMSMRNDRLAQQEEMCYKRYIRDCEHIERKQDDVRRQRALLQELDEQIYFDVRQAEDQLGDYAHTRDIHLHQTVTACHNQISYTQAQAMQFLEQSQEDLLAQGRRLQDEREERENAYRQEMRTLNKNHKDSFL